MKPGIITISGAPGSGKSSVARMIRELYPEPITVISMSKIARLLSETYDDKTIFTGDKFPNEVPLMRMLTTLDARSPNKITIVEGMPRHLEQYYDLKGKFRDICMIMLECDNTVAFQRITARGDYLDDYSLLLTRFTKMSEYYNEMISKIPSEEYHSVYTTNNTIKSIADYIIKEIITPYVNTRAR